MLEDARRQHAQVARHAEVHDQGAGVEADQEVLAAATDVQDALPYQRLGNVRREGPAQALTAEHDLFDHATFQVGCDPAPGHFYFGEFRHENLTKFL